MFHVNTKKLGAMAAATLIAATAVQAAVAAPAQAFGSSGMGTAVVQQAAPYAGPAAMTQTERMILDQINAYRAENGVRAITLDGGFANGAREWAQHLADTGKAPSHPENGNFFENVAYSASPERAVSLWKNSAGHNANMLNSQITHGGVGVVPRADGTFAVVFRGLWEPAGADNSKGHPAW